MTTRRIVLVVLGVLLLVGVGNFIVRSVQIRNDLSRIAGADTARQEEGVRNLIARDALFDALQGGAPKNTRLNAVAALERVAGKGDQPKAFEQLIQLLKDPDTESAEAKTHPVRDAATDAVARVGAQYPDRLIDAAKDVDKAIQDQGRKALRTIGAPLKEKMAARLGDTKLRTPLGEILASIGPETIALITPYLAPGELQKIAKPEDQAKAKVQLIEVLGKFTVPEAVEPIVPFKDDSDPNVRRTVITSLSNIAQPNAAPVLIQALQNSATDTDARQAAAGALGIIASPEASAALVQALDEYDLRVAGAAAAGLKRAGNKAAQAVGRALEHSDPAVRAWAAEASGGMTTPALAARALSDPDALVRGAAAFALGDMVVRSLRIKEELAKIAGADPAVQEQGAQSLLTSGVLKEALQGAGMAPRQNAVAAFERMAAAKKKKKDGDKLRVVASDLSATAADAGKPPVFGSDQAAIAPLLRALGDQNGRVASLASQSLSRIGEPVVGALVTRLSGSSDTVAYYASQALAAIGTPAVAPLVSVAQNNRPGARWAAVALGQIGDAGAAPALEALSRSSDADAAYAAGIALNKVRPS